MRVTHTKFDPLIWRPNKTVLNPNINPEVEYFSINTQDYISFQPIIGKPKNNTLPFAFVTLKWMYTIENKSTHKELFYYEADDKHTADTSKPENKEQEIKKAINTSYKRFTDHFDNRKQELGLREENCPELSQDEIDQIYHDIISRLW